MQLPQPQRYFCTEVTHDPVAAALDDVDLLVLLELDVQALREALGVTDVSHS
jgi:hypothetical protein